jgi:hypothetical protein
MRLAAQAADGQPQFPPEFVEILAAAIPQLGPLQQIPHPLIGIEIRSVAGQALQVQSRGRARGEEVLHRLAVVDGRAVPDHQQLTPDLTEQLAEEGDNRRPTERLGLDMGEQPPVRGDSADRREVVTRERDAQNGSVAAWGICARHEGEQIKCRFVYEDDRALLGLGFA